MYNFPLKFINMYQNKFIYITAQLRLYYHYYLLMYKCTSAREHIHVVRNLNICKMNIYNYSIVNNSNLLM